MCNNNKIKTYHLETYQNDEYTGHGVTVFVQECNGVAQKSHKALKNQNIEIINSYFSKEHRHATSMTSLINGHDGTKQYGVAANTKVISGMTSDIFASGYQYEIISSSFGLKDYAHFYHNGKTSSFNDFDQSKLLRGNGIAQFYSSGNDNEYVLDQRKNSLSTFVVANHNPSGIVTLNSGYGACVDITTLGKDVDAAVIDLKNHSKTEAISGTSISTAITSGVASLCKEANPKLSNFDLYNIFILSANTPNQHQYYGNMRNKNIQKNKGGLWYSFHHGFGNLNPKCHRLAETYINYKYPKDLQTYEITLNQHHKFKKHETIEYTLELQDDFELIGAEVRAKILVPNNAAAVAKNITYSVQSPSGTNIRIFDASKALATQANEKLFYKQFVSFASLAYLDFQSSTHYFWNESSKGKWSLTFQNQNSKKRYVQLTRFSLKISGFKKSNRKSFYITDEMPSYEVINFYEKKYNDFQYLNLTLVEGNLKMFSNEMINTANHNLYKNIDSFKGYFFGDGNDKIQAHGYQKIIYPGRGNDIVQNHGAGTVFFDSYGNDTYDLTKGSSTFFLNLANQGDKKINIGNNHYNIFVIDTKMSHFAEDNQLFITHNINKGKLTITLPKSKYTITWNKMSKARPVILMGKSEYGSPHLLDKTVNISKGLFVNSKKNRVEYIQPKYMKRLPKKLSVMKPISRHSKHIQLVDNS